MFSTQRSQKEDDAGGKEQTKPWNILFFEVKEIWKDHSTWMC